MGTNTQISDTLHPLPAHTRTLFPGLKGAAGILGQQCASAGFFAWLSPMQNMLTPLLLPHNQESYPSAGTKRSLKPPCFSQQHPHFPDLCFGEPQLTGPALHGSPPCSQHFWPKSNAFISTLAFPFNILLFRHLTPSSYQPQPMFLTA